MVGTAKKNENSAAAFLVRFCCIPPIIEAALLLVPGIIARHCQKPIVNAFLKVISFSSSIVCLVKIWSIKSKMTPPKIKTTAMGIGFSNTVSILSSNNFPKTKAGKTATANFK